MPSSEYVKEVENLGKEKEGGKETQNLSKLKFAKVKSLSWIETGGPSDGKQERTGKSPY